MRVSFLLSLIVLLMFSYGTMVSAQTSFSDVFTANLSLGSRGPQVVALQKILNTDPDTRVASIGPGSPGYETSYFGPLTRTSVARFQEKYANEVLAPVGLAQGNGFVGSYTRAKLATLASVSPAVVQVSVVPAAAVATTTPLSPATATEPTVAAQNPNLENIDAILAAINKVGVAQGMSSSALATVKAHIVKSLATTTDLHAVFLKTVPNPFPHQTIKNASPFGKVFAIIEQVFDSIFLPERALASVGVPFGGRLLGVVPCNVGFNLVVQPLPPTFVTVLYYVEGTQVYLSRNIPTTSNLLGIYAPGGGGCVISFVYIPSEGTITPMVGSSPS